MWSTAADEHNQALLHRQQVLADAWATMKGSSAEGEAFVEAWLQVRIAALEDNGFDPIWR